MKKRSTKQHTKDQQEPLVLSQNVISSIQQNLLAWYRKGHRDLPWRSTSDPYAIWVSEIMLQQTRVETVKTYYQRFLERFPTFVEMARAPVEEVLALWSGLGYYSRARQLHKAAQQLVSQDQGVFPSSLAGIRALSGIGPYTAGAIASIAFGLPTPLVDGNVIRVLSRLFARNASPESSTGRAVYWNIAAQLMPVVATSHNNPGDFNQALMELGATVCVPQNPTCLLCPVRGACMAYQQGEVPLYPPKKKAIATPVVQVRTLLIQHQGDWLLVQRPKQGLWGGLFEPLTVPHTEDFSWSRVIQEQLGASLGGCREIRTETTKGGASSARRDEKSYETYDDEEQHSDAMPLLSVDDGRISLHPLTAAEADIEARAPFVHQLTHRTMEFSPFFLRWRGRRPDIHAHGFYEAHQWVSATSLHTVGLAAWAKRLLTHEMQHVDTP